MASLDLWLMVFLRAGAMLSVFPVFSARHIPLPVRGALAALLSLFIAPVLPSWNLPTNLPACIGWMAAELAIGLLLGFVGRLLFFALDLAGSVITAQIGLSLPANFDPISEGQSSAPSALLHYFAIVLWLTLDLHHWLLVTFRRTYEILPIASATASQPLLQDVLARAAWIFTLALQMAAPIIAVSFVVTLVFAVLGRAVPQMNVFFESFAFRILAGFVVLGSTVQLLSAHIINGLRRIPEDLLRIAHLLSSG